MRLQIPIFNAENLKENDVIYSIDNDCIEYIESVKPITLNDNIEMLEIELMNHKIKLILPYGKHSGSFIFFREIENPFN